MREYAVHPALAPFVKCIWSLESDAPIRDAGRERILPDSCVELVFHFRDTYRSHFASGESALQPASFVVGQMRRFLEIEPTGRAGLVAVRFFARGAYLFFRRPLHEVAAGVVDLEDLWRARAREWTERIALADGMPARLRFIEQALLSLLRANGRTDPAVDRALHLIDARRGLVGVDDLAGGGGRPEGVRAHQAVPARGRAAGPGRATIPDGGGPRQRLLRPGALQPRVPRSRGHEPGRLRDVPERQLLSVADSYKPFAGWCPRMRP
jgi:hypothetical protein